MSTFSPPAPPPIDSEEPELIVLDEQPPDSGHNRGDSGEPVRKKCMLGKLLGTSFSDSSDTSVTVSYNELVMAELSRYKSEPILKLKGKPLDRWKNYQHSYPNLSRMACRYLGVVATSVPSERLFSTAGNVVTMKRCALEPENVEKLVFLHDNLPPVKLSYQRLK